MSNLATIDNTAQIYLNYAAISELSYKFNQTTGWLTLLTIPVFFIFIFVLRAQCGKGLFAQAGLSGGRVTDWVTYGLFAVAIVQGLNYLSHQISKFLFPTSWESFALSTPNNNLTLFRILILPIGALFFYWGREYGWRGFLQSELIKLGNIKGFLLTGFIVSVIDILFAMMIGQPLLEPRLGSPIAIVVSNLLGNLVAAFVLGYIVLKTKSIWLIAYIASLNAILSSFLPLYYM